MFRFKVRKYYILFVYEISFKGKLQLRVFTTLVQLAGNFQIIFIQCNIKLYLISVFFSKKKRREKKESRSGRVKVGDY